MISLPDPSALAQEFSDAVWTKEFSNVSSPKLIEAWKTLFHTYNDSIENNQSCTQPVRKKVVSMPTGTGKSQATIHYLRKFYDLEELEDIGVLVITFFTAEAEQACDSINKSEIAHTANYHSADHNLSDTLLGNTQVLYITHAQYLLALQDSERLKKLNTYRKKPRSLIIIDESISQINDHRITLDDFRTATSKITELLEADNLLQDSDKKKLKEEKDYLNSIMKLMDSLENKITRSSGVYASNEQIETIKNPLASLNCLKSFCSGDKAKILKRIDSSTNFLELKELIDTLIAIQTQDICYFSKGLYGLALNTVSWIDIQDKNTVILDATADINQIYKLHKNIDVVSIPSKLRRYKNVTLHVSEQIYNLGRKQLDEWSTLENIRDHFNQLIEYLSPFKEEYALEVLSAEFDKRKPKNELEDKILIVTHANVAKKIRDFLNIIKNDYRYPTHPGIEIGHWGNLTGKNDFKDYNKIVIIGFFNKPETHTTNLHITSDTGLCAIRKYNHSDIAEEIESERTEIKHSDLAAEVIQAINRIRCRSVIDKEGNCSKSDIYLLNTSDRNSFNYVLNKIEKHMPEIQILTDSNLVLSDGLKHNSEGRTGRPTDEYDNMFINYVVTLPDGTYKTSDIKRGSTVSERPMKRIWKSIQDAQNNYDDSNTLHAFCKEHGISLRGSGRGKMMVKSKK